MRCARVVERSRWSAAVLSIAVSFSSLTPDAARAEDWPLLETKESSDSPFALLHTPKKRRSDILAPFFSLLLPGLDQWQEGQHTSAALYSGVALSGLVYANHIATHNTIRRSDDNSSGLDAKDNVQRKYTLGVLIYQGAGGMSAYHAFRSAVRSRQPYGEYQFLQHEDTPRDILAAPFDVRYFLRPSALIPLGLLAAVSYADLRFEPDNVERLTFTGADAFFTGAFSYNAATHEEAVFRGWLMPVMMQSWGSPFWSNATQSVAFAAAHLTTNSTPLPQLLLGYYLGWVTQENGWRLGEAVFIHFWWDVLAFAASYSYKRRLPEDKKNLIEPSLRLPPIEWRF